jgi:hypothetical protein
MSYAFTLPDTDGVEHGPGDAPATVVVFTCNHCPYARAWHERLIAVARDYPTVRTLHVCANDPERHPTDGPEEMARRVAAGEFDGVPYLYDVTQDVARAYDAQTTPDVFVLDAELNLHYRGAPDAAYDDPSQNAMWLRQALDAVLAGREPGPAHTVPVGCSIKWKQAPA